jgi:hypothetical protein
MTSQADLEGSNRRSDLGTCNIHTAHVGRRISHASAHLRRVRVMAISTLNMPRISYSRLGRIVDRRGVLDTMRRHLVDHSHDVIGSHVAIVTGRAVAFFRCVAQ